MNAVQVSPCPRGFEALGNLRQMKQNAPSRTTIAFRMSIDQVQIWIIYFRRHRSCSTHQVQIKPVSFRLDLWVLVKHSKMHYFKRLFSGHQIYWFKLYHQVKKSRRLITAFFWKLNGTAEVDKFSRHRESDLTVH